MATFVDGYLDRSYSYEIFRDGSVLSGKHDPLGRLNFDPQEQVVCFDSRKLHVLGMERTQYTYDLKLLYSHDGELSRLVRSIDIPIRGDYLELEKRFSAHTRAISEAKVDVEKIPLRELIPDDLRLQYMYARLSAMRQLWERLTGEQIEEYRKIVYPVFKDILIVEQSGIKIDEPYVEKQLRRNDLAVHENKFFRHIQGNLKNGFVRTKISPVGSKTWRLRVEGGFNCMAVPHGAARKAIISRFEGGSILTLDFNAIDYRCLVEATNDPGLNAVYAGQRDFHSATANIFGEVSPELRDQTKKITYAHIYGSSTETLQKLTGLSRERIGEMIRRLDERFAPITKFRKELSDRARADGFVITPAGHRIEVEKGDHDGKIVGLYAQTYSSSMLNRALHAVLEFLLGRKSKVIFTVHDEIVIDLHPDDLIFVPMILDTMEEATGFVVKANRGVNYGEATD